MNEHEYARFGRTAFGAVSGSKLARIRQHAGHSILDVGCGPGLYLERLANLGYQVAGVDGNSVFVEQARLVAERVWRVDLESERLSFLEDASFDTVLMLDVLEHVDGDEELLRDALRVCRQNVILTVPAKMPDDLKGSQLVFGAYVDPTHKRYYSFPDLSRLLAEAGSAKYFIESALRFDPIIYSIFPPHLRYPLSLLNRVLLKISNPNLFTTVWYAVVWKGVT